MADFHDDDKEDDEVKIEFIGAINRSNDHRFVAMVDSGSGIAMGAFFIDRIYEGVATEQKARKAVRKLVERDKWERLTEEQAMTYF